MYMTLQEAAEYLDIPLDTLKKLIYQGKIKFVEDENGEIFINKNQFDTHLKQMEKYKKLVEEYLNTPLPEDIDVKDEDQL